MPFVPGKSGNAKGRPPGIPNRPKAVVSVNKARRTLDRSAVKIIQEVIDRGLAGDTACLTMAFGRLIPARKDLPMQRMVEDVNSSADAEKVAASIMRLMLAGRCSPSDAATALQAVRAFGDIAQAREICRRLEALERGTAPFDPKMLEGTADEPRPDRSSRLRP
jgi:hypothetical protein